jgi:predicted nuclease of restriction endonuclease-like (RecB) superfamily
MSRTRKIQSPSPVGPEIPGYDTILNGMVELLEASRRSAARAVNFVMTATYWEVGRRIVEYEQSGEEHADYGTVLITRLATDLIGRFGRGFGKSNLYQMRGFYVAFREIFQTLSGKLDPARPPDLARQFPLPWSHYVELLKVDKAQAREFYEAEALRNGWTVRQLERQITTLFYERTLASRNKAAMLRKGAAPKPEDLVTAEEIKDPLVLEFLDLKDEYSEGHLEEALIGHLESFLLELGGDFTFLGRQKRLRVDDSWNRIDLLFYHRRLRCLVVIELLCNRLHNNCSVAFLLMGRPARCGREARTLVRLDVT